MTGTRCRIDPARDREDWYTLAVGYAFAVDHRDEQELAALFEPGGVVVLPAALARAPDHVTELEPASAIESVRRFLRTRHVVEQQVARRDGADGATGETYCTAHHLYRRDGGLSDYVMTIRYLDTFRRLSVGWRFARRGIEVDWVETRAVAEVVPS